MSTLLLGTHLRASKEENSAFKTLARKGGNLVQLCIPPLKLKEPLSLTEKTKENLKHSLAKYKLTAVVHSSFTLNLAQPWDKTSWWILLLLHEIEIAAALGAKSIVVHTGCRLALSEEEAQNYLYTALIYILKKTSKYPEVSLLLETPAGQGSEILASLSEFGTFFKRILKVAPLALTFRLGICIDFCHLFVAGLDFAKQGAFTSLKTLLPLERVWLVHLSDSQFPRKSRRDRHAPLGTGYLGWQRIYRIFSFILKHKFPTILETPSTFPQEIPLLRKKERTLEKDIRSFRTRKFLS